MPEQKVIFPEKGLIDRRIVFPVEYASNVGDPIIWPWVKILGTLIVGHYAIIGVLPRPPAKTTVTQEMDEPLPTTIYNNVTVGNHAIVYAGVTLRDGVYIADFASVRERTLISEGTIIGRGVTIESDVTIGRDVRIEDNAQITPGAIIEDQVFIGPGVETTNDPFMGRNSNKKEWYQPVKIRWGARIGANATICPGVTIGEEAVVGAGSVVTKDIPNGEVWFGNPAHFHRLVADEEKLYDYWHRLQKEREKCEKV